MAARSGVLFMLLVWQVLRRFGGNGGHLLNWSGNDFNPAGCAYSTHSPDDHGSASLISRPIKGDVSGVIKIGCPLATMLIKVGECFGLYSEGHQVVSFGMQPL